MKTLLVVTLLLISSTGICRADCLKTAGDFAVRICGDIQRIGSSSIVEGGGELKASVSGVVRRALGEAGGSFSGKAVSDAYENVLREDLGKELFDVRQCRQKMAQVGIEQACGKINGPSTGENKGYINGTDITLFIDRKKLEKQLGNIEKTCEWTVNEQKTTTCSAPILWMGIPFSLSANFQKNTLSSLDLNAKFSWRLSKDKNEHNIKEKVDGNGESVKKYCAPTTKNKILSDLISKYGAPTVPPEEVSEDQSDELRKNCEGEFTRVCETGGKISSENYNFKASKDVSLRIKFSYDKGHWYRENVVRRGFGIEWDRCRISVYFTPS